MALKMKEMRKRRGFIPSKITLSNWHEAPHRELPCISILDGRVPLSSAFFYPRDNTGPWNITWRSDCECTNCRDVRNQNDLEVIRNGVILSISTNNSAYSPPLTVPPPAVSFSPTQPRPGGIVWVNGVEINWTRVIGANGTSGGDGGNQ